MVASGGVVALVPESAEMGAADPTRPEFMMAWVDNICAERSEVRIRCGLLPCGPRVSDRSREGRDLRA